jgi:hypothetical protein
LGAASISQAMAPTKGGVTSEAMTSVRIVRASGMSVRATSQPSGAATRQQIALTEQAMISVVISGSTKVGSVNSATKLANVMPPSLPVRLTTSSQPTGSTIIPASRAATAARTGREKSKLRVIP